jgi:hypothetical protein
MYLSGDNLRRFARLGVHQLGAPTAQPCMILAIQRVGAWLQHLHAAVLATLDRRGSGYG